MSAGHFDFDFDSDSETVGLLPAIKRVTPPFGASLPVTVFSTLFGTSRTLKYIVNTCFYIFNTARERTLIRFDYHGTRPPTSLHLVAEDPDTSGRLHLFSIIIYFWLAFDFIFRSSVQ